ncbi:MAG: ATP-binding protein [Gemmatimonadetes bacterium]|nr:ATP-binding protein [Gemmatimonadota bacterium]
MDSPRAKTPTIRKFNPGTFQSDEEVIRQFVVREHELGVVLDVLRDNVDAPSCQHILLVAPRGRGKTMLLARVAAELRSGDELSQRLLPVRFMEESHEILDIADFWLETIFYLSREIAGGDPDFGRELHDTHTDLKTRWRGDSLAERAKAVVLDASDRLGRKFVLMVENMQTLCDDVDDDFGWQLRETLQTEPQIILLGTAISRFKDLEEAQEPFFELFRTIHLEPLDTDACGRLWRMISGDEVTKRSIRPLQILTGGGPRLLVIVAEFARHRSFPQLMEELVTLVDNHTEYFRGHLEALPPTERRVYLAVIDLWQPSTTSEIAARARMGVRKVSSLLGRLVDRGAVIVHGTGRKQEYVTAERLFSIYYKMRRERDEAAVVRNLIQFMRVFYNEDELEEMSEVLRLEEAAQGMSGREEFFEKARIGLERIQHLLSPEDLSIFRSATDDDASTEHIDEGKPIKSDFQMAGVMLKQANEQRKTGELQAALSSCESVVDQFAERNEPKLRTRVAIAMVLKGILQLKCKKSDAALTIFDELIGKFTIYAAPNIQALVSHAYLGKTWILLNRSDLGNSLTTYDVVVNRHGVVQSPCFPAIRNLLAGTMLEKGATEYESGDYKKAIATFDDMIQRFADSDEPQLWMLVSVALARKATASSKLGDNAGETAAYEDMIRRRTGSDDLPHPRVFIISAIVVKAGILVSTGDTEEALRECDEADRMLGSVLGENTGLTGWTARLARNIRGYDVKPDPKMLGLRLQVKLVRVRALLGQEKLQAAMDEFRSAYATFDPSNGLMLRSMIRGLIMIFSTGASSDDIVKIMESDEKKAKVMNPLFVALHRRLGDKVRAPAEVLEVADDIVAEMNKAQSMR